MSHLPEQREVILGVDTHLDLHVAVLVDGVGRIVATTSIPTTACGYERLNPVGAQLWPPQARRYRGHGDVWRGTCPTIARARHTGARDQSAGSFSEALARQE